MKEVTGEQVIDFLKTNKDKLMKEFHLSKLGLFGSYARGDNTPKSDIDLLVEFEPGDYLMWDNFLSMQRKMTRRLGRKVDVCEENYLHPLIKKNALNHAIFI